MARKPRIEIAGVPYHLIIRGNNRETIFIDENCYIRYLDLLKGYKLIHNYKIYCYCLIPNHIHLVLEASEDASISKIMQCINTSYTLYFNKKFNRTGHVLEGRYKSKFVEENEYLLHLSRYIHMNPVKYGFCKKAEYYEHSSAKYYLTNYSRDKLVDISFIFNVVSDNVILAKEEYKNFMEDGYNLYNSKEWEWKFKI